MADTRTTYRLSNREIATILAALRHFEDDYARAVEAFREHGYFQMHAPLNKNEIDRVAVYLNIGGR
jgi:hypothetical protein